MGSDPRDRAPGDGGGVVEIVYVIGSLDVGGAERHLVRIVPRLDATRFRPVVFCLTHRGTQAPELENAGIEVVAPAWPGRAVRGGPLPMRVLRLLVSAGSLLWLLLRRRPRIVHFFLPAPYLVGTICAVLTARPTLLMSRRSLNDYQKKRPALAWLERRFHRRMDAILGNSRAVVRQLRDEEGVPEAKLRLLYNGIDLAPAAAAPERGEARRMLGLADDAVVFVLLANLIPYKGHADLLDALGLAAERLPAGWRLLCVGRDTGIRDDLHQRAERLGIAGGVSWLGERRDVAALLAASDVGLLVSHEEGFSNAVLECMAAGLPMIVTDVGGNAEAVRDGECGRVVPARDPRRLAAALVELASSAELRARFGASGRARVEREFTLERCVAEYEDCYAAVLKHRAVAAPA